MTMSETTDRGAEPLFMVQMRLEMRGLTEIGKMLGLRLAKVDDSYLVHCALGKLFQDRAPQPYALGKRDGRHIRVLGYGSTDAEGLHHQAKTFAEPSVYQRACDWDMVASKPMPVDFPAGMELSFELRVCPVIRKSSDGPRWHAGQELDAFLAEAWKPENEDVDLDRESIYRDWLEGHFERRGGARPLRIGMERFSINRMTRRGHGPDRAVKRIQRPDVTMTGRLEVTDGGEFRELLRSGVGRHKSFGFGMLKIRPT